ncbi:MAG: Tfp pilus tip-associated adhesin PilY1 [Methylophagaceae bacterium]|jgi:Tfp pilus tip-associated adhesin PilY1
MGEQLMTFYTKSSFISLLFLFTTVASAASLNVSNTPLYLGGSIKPNIMVMLDNSGSMKTPMYDASGWRGSVRTSFDSNIDYSGIFDATKKYKYNASILVNTAAYGGIGIDSTKKGAFYETACTPAAGERSCWSGRYLNWLSARRIDASRTVLIGGKLESRTAFSYGSGYQYKIVANNEYADDTFGGKLSNSDNFSPVPNDQTVMVTSPAHENGGAQMSLYDPYAKLNVVGGSGNGLMYNATNTQIGEFGQVDILADVNNSGVLKNASWTSVTFSQSYASPVVIAKPPSFNGGDPGLIRIKDVTATGFKISFQEWPYRDGNHTTEQISYLVVEAGSHTLPGGHRLDAGLTYTSADSGSSCTNGSPESPDSVAFSAFPSSPIVIAATMTHLNPDAVNVRVSSISTTGFEVSLQQQEDVTSTSLSAEKIGYIAITPGKSVDTTNQWLLEADTKNNVDEDDKTITFSSSFSSTPVFLAGMTSINDADPAVLRLKNINASTAKIFVEEEKSCDNGQGHGNEDVNYIALEGGSSALNLALVTATEPVGLLQKIAPDVRLGTSFYRYPPNENNIYNGVTTQGGTLRFNIPNNPFVKKPSATGGGGYRNLNGYITTPIADIVDSLEHYPLIWGTTPLAENLWEVIQYFEQDTPHYSDVATGFKDFDLADISNPERDPYYYAEVGKKLWCAKSSVIVFTDGFPFKDADVPLSVQDYDGDSANDDNVSTNVNAQGRDNLDDVAYWAFCDKSKGTCFDNPASATRKAVNGSRDLRSDITGNTSDKGQFLQVHTVGFADGTIRPILQDTADNAGGFAYAAEDGNALRTALTEAFTAAAAVSSASSVALNSGSISGNSKLYQARFDSSSWAGQLLAYPINVDGTLGSLSWNAASLIPAPASRVLFTHNGTSGAPFQWSTGGISTSQKALLANDINVLNYLRGVQSLEIANGGSYRNRSTVLGDIVHSPPSFVGPPSASYPDNWGSGADENSALYSAFKTTHINRTPMVYVGANDGMYHAFNASTGVEQFAYIPSAVYGRLNNLTNSNLTHNYLVDGQSTIVDAFFDSAWHTVAISTLGAGGQGVFALDVSSLGDFNTEGNASSKVLWEFTDANDADLGYTFGQASIVRLHTGKWAAVFSGGYNNTIDNDSDGSTNDSTTGNATLYIVDIETGALIKKFDTKVGTAQDPTSNNRPNGLSTPSVIDINGDLIADYIFAGDLFGNVWKIDITGAVGSWAFSYKAAGKPVPVFTACDGSSCSGSNVQPITTQIQVSKHPQATGFLLYFGTGQYFEVGDNSSTGQNTQSFYGIWDKAESSLSTFSRSNLLQQSILQEVTASTFNLRLTTQNIIDWSTDSGWYIDLFNTESSNTNNYGERVISNAIVKNGRIIFTTLLPLEDPCEFGGSGWLMELDSSSGARLAYSPFDINGDGVFNVDDYYHNDTNNNGIVDAGEQLIPVSGKKSKVGIISTPSIIDSPDGEIEYKYTSGSSGVVEVTVENPGANVYGRQSWRQLDFN